MVLVSDYFIIYHRLLSHRKTADIYGDLLSHGAMGYLQINPNHSVVMSDHDLNIETYGDLGYPPP